MTDREVDALIAEKVMGWEYKYTSSTSPAVWMNGKETMGIVGEWAPSTDRNAAALVLERIGENPQWRASFLDALIDDEAISGSDLTWALVTATPAQLMDACLQCVENSSAK